MGAYTNPQAVIDTTGQVWANAINNLNNFNLKKAEEERNTLLQYNKDFANKMEKVTNAGINEMRTIKRNAIQNKVLKEEEMTELTDRMNEKTHFQKLALTASGKELTDLNSRINALDTQLMSYVTFKKTNLDATNTYMKDNIGGNVSNFGRQGYASVSVDNQYAVAKMVDSGYLEGKKKAVYDEKRGWGYEYNTGGQETKEGGKDLIEGDDKTFTIFNDEDQNFQPVNIPETDKYYTNLLEELGIMKKGVLQTYYHTDKGSTRKIDPKTGLQSIFWNADMEKIAIKVDTALNTQLGIAGGGSAYSDKEKISIWKDIFQKQTDLRFDGDGGAMNEDDKEDFNKMFKERLGKFIPEFDVVVGEDNIMKLQEETGVDFGTTKLSFVDFGKVDGDGLNAVQTTEAAQGIMDNIFSDFAGALNNYSMNSQDNSRVIEKEIDGDTFLIFKGLKNSKGEDVPHNLNISTEIGLQKAFNEIINSKGFKSNVLGDDNKDDKVRRELNQLFKIKSKDFRNKRNEEISISNSNASNRFNAYFLASGNPKYKTLSEWEKAGEPKND